MSLLGLDIGTSGCKGAAYSLDGTLLASSYQEYPTIHQQPGWGELDSRQVWRQIQDVIRTIADQTKHDPIAALSMSTMGEAMTPVSHDRKILGNSILHSDTRGETYIRQLREKIGQERFYQINPNILGVNYSLPKLKWLQEHQSDLYAQTYKFLLWGDFVAFMLGCEPLTSFSHANRTLLFDIRRETWSDELVALTGIEREQLPTPAASGTIAGTISDEMADALHLPRKIPVVVGGHDQCCNSLGSGIYQAGKAVCGIGTVECITPTYDAIPDAAQMLKTGLNVEHHVLPGLYVSFIYNQAGTLIRWFRDTFAAAEHARQDIYDLFAREMPQEPTSLLTLPYFEPTGTPHFIADASGAILGLKTSTTRGEIFKSLMECETLYFVESLLMLKERGIDTSEFIATGGGAKSDAWLQIKADVFGVPFVRPKVVEAGTLGAAMLAGLAIGALRSPQDATACFVKQERRFEPDMRRHAIYQEKYAKYQQLYPAVKHLL
ncbi:xylulokinase [Candidatus Moduliflexus flocculans]|uniref:Xylulokinase n=1 Tax=Candidatus Moduliflexus flocculans TaxID=1499966 RepID=A0A081BNR2_9BACT|nr:xylulokinase [Candidatus Moduliflexus flocculans]